jgi:hypothetical protein
MKAKQHDTEQETFSFTGGLSNHCSLRMLMEESRFISAFL